MKELIEKLALVWRQNLPDVEVPQHPQLRKWLQIGPVEVCEYAIQRTGRKFAKVRWIEGRLMDGGECVIYCSSVLHGEMNQRGI